MCKKVMACEIRPMGIDRIAIRLIHLIVLTESVTWFESVCYMFE